MNGHLFAEHAPLWRACLMDPPWKAEEGGGGRGAQNHYSLLSTEDVLRVVRSSGVWRPFEDAHFYLWVTNAVLANKEGHWLMEQLGFRPVTVLTWPKEEGFGIGQYFRGRTEHLLFGVRGHGMDPSVLTDARNLDTVVRGRKAEHSTKPAESYSKVEARSHGPYLSVFHRGPPPNERWQVWGNEATPGSGQREAQP